MQRMKKILLSFILLISPFWVEAQCSMCKAVVESNMQSDANAVGAGINDGIMYLMIFPYLVFIGIGIIVYRLHMKNKRAEQKQ